jgi:HNH endonuclease
VTDGKPVSVGRAQRSVPARTRRLVHDRDRGCVFPGCLATRFVEVHHLDPWSEGGATDLNRLVDLCTYHHDGLHRGEFRINGSPGSLQFVNSRGLLIAPAPQTVAGPAPPDLEHPDGTPSHTPVPPGSASRRPGWTSSRTGSHCPSFPTLGESLLTPSACIPALFI